MGSGNAASNAMTTASAVSPSYTGSYKQPLYGVGSSGYNNLGKAYLAIQGMSSLAGLLGGVAAVGATASEAERMNAQATLALAEARRDAQLKANEVRSFREQQSSVYSNSGVNVYEGSPIEVLASTVRKGQSEIDAIWERGKAQAALYKANAAQTRRSGWASLVGGAMSGLSTAGTAYIQSQRLGLLQSQPKQKSFFNPTYSSNPSITGNA